MTWTELDWKTLDRLRERFLTNATVTGPYWETGDDLAHYDFTYAERIGWKWDQVLRELQLRGWRPSSRSIIDWGCGSGIASRRVLSFYGAANFDALTVWDHSPLACNYAADRARVEFPNLTVSQATPGFLTGSDGLGLLVISHVLNELPPSELQPLLGLIARAEAVIWVEPGTHAISRQLGQHRDAVRSRFRIVAPCTHQLGCPMFAEGNERDWCHFFAPPPPEIFADSNWVKFGQRAGIDLRSLPYAFVALEATTLNAAQSQAGELELSRIIGRPEHFKPYARFLNCDAAGLAELTLPKRADPTLFKKLERSKAPLVYRWRRDGDTVTGGETFQNA